MNKIKLVKNSTPLQMLRYRVGTTQIYMKRDDLIGFGGGGNKVRLFEYIASDIQDSMRKNGCKKIITFGSAHSNHVRVAAVVALRLGIKCDLIILVGDDEIDKRENTLLGQMPNLKLTYYCPNVRIELCNTKDAYDFIDEYLEKQKAMDINYYWIPGGGHVPIAVQGYMDAGEELMNQSEHMGFKADAVFVPCGTGTTQAGLIRGVGNRSAVFGITVARSVERCKEEILSLMGMDPSCSGGSVEVLPNPIRYGEKDSNVDKMIEELVKSDGIFLDPVYNAKSFLAMVRYLKNHSGMENVIYVNTGGYPNLFA